MSSLTGKNAIITGAGRGIGRAYALKLASMGARVAVVDRDLTSFTDFAAEAESMTAASTVDEIVEAGGEAFGIEVDVTDRAALEAMAKQVADKWGTIDILVANAGGGSATHLTTTASDLTTEDLETVLQRNLYGTIYTVNAVAPYMKSQRSGKIVTMSSRAGSAASKEGGYAHYGAAKAGVAMYTRYLAQDLGPYGINCNAIAPGVIGTGRIMQNIASRYDVTSIPLQRYGRPEDCANLVAFLVSDEASYISGAVIPVDGGLNPGAA